MKYTFLFLVLFGSITTMTAQSITQQVITSAGTYQSLSEYGNLHWTLGEPMNKQFETEMNLTQGFIQVFELISTAIKAPISKFSVKIFPNPTAEQLFISKEGLSKIHLQLFNLNGQLLKDFAFWNQSESIDLSSYQSGTYLLKVIDENGSFETFKIQKISF